MIQIAVGRDHQVQFVYAERRQRGKHHPSAGVEAFESRARVHQHGCPPTLDEERAYSRLLPCRRLQGAAPGCTENVAASLYAASTRGDFESF